MRTRFRISGLRHMISDTLKKKMGVRNYRILCGVIMGALLATVTIPMALKGNGEESYAINASANPVDIRFLNTQSVVNGNNECAVIKTYDNKYILVDTGAQSDAAVDIIYNALDGWQNGGNGGNVVIDYLIVSHLDGDHVGNAVGIMRNQSGKTNSKIKVKNVVVKYEKSLIDYRMGTGVSPNQGRIYRDILAIAALKGANIITSDNFTLNTGEDETLRDLFNYDKHEAGYGFKYSYGQLKEYVRNGNHLSFLSDDGQSIKIGKYLDLYFYNVDDVYAGHECGYGNVIRWTTSSSNATSFNGSKKVIYYDTKTGKFSSTSNSNTKAFYARVVSTTSDGKKVLKTINSCRSNANSYGVLADIHNENSTWRKFAYFANDIDNMGYSEVIPETKTINYKYHDYRNGGGISSGSEEHIVFGNSVGVTYDFSKCTADGKTCTIAYSDRVSKYRIHAAAESRAALSVAAQIKSQGNLSDLVIYQESHHGMNNAADAIETLGLTGTGISAKTFAIASRLSAVDESNLTNYIPRNGHYKFRNNNDNDKVTEFITGSMPDGISCRVKIDGTYLCNKLTVGFAKKKLSYNANGGTGAPAEESCGTINNIAAGGSTYLDSVCQKSVSSVAPTRAGYSFMGWSTSKNATTSTYKAGDLVELSDDQTVLYAVWQKKININTSVNGGNGKITGSMSNVAKGTKVTIAFTPDRGYKVGTVTVNGTETSVSNNRLELTAGDSDITVVVTFVAEETPSSVIYTLTYVANGGTNAPDSQSCEVIEGQDSCNIVISNTVPIYENYNFLGWATSPDAKIGEHLAGETYPISSNVVLYAVWADGNVEWQQDQYYTKGSSESPVVKIGYPYEDFVSLEIDGVTVDSVNYDVTQTGTIILHNDYINTLPDGIHVLIANYKNNVAAETVFSVATDDGGDLPYDPEPGDSDYDPDDPDAPGDPDGPSPVNPDDPYNSDADGGEDADEDDYIPVPSTSAGTPDTGENTGNNIGGNIAVMILPVVLAGLATLAYKRNINKTHRKFD